MGLTSVVVSATVAIFTVTSPPSKPAQHVIRPPASLMQPAKAPVKPLVCQDPPPSWVAWYPGQIAPYILYGSTVTGQLVYESPPGIVTLVLRRATGSGAFAIQILQMPLAEWCR